MTTHEPDAPEGVPTQDPIEEIAHTATEPLTGGEVAAGELLDDDTSIVIETDDELTRVTA